MRNIENIRARFSYNLPVHLDQEIRRLAALDAKDNKVNVSAMAEKLFLLGMEQFRNPPTPDVA